MNMNYYMYVDVSSDEYGQTTHTIIENEQGEVLFNEFSGDWCYTRPNAYLGLKSLISKEKALALGAKFP